MDNEWLSWLMLAAVLGGFFGALLWVWMEEGK